MWPPMQNRLHRPRNRLSLNSKKKTVGVPIGTEAEARLEGVGGCSIHAIGEVLVNKKLEDKAGNFGASKFEGSNCGSSPSEEKIEEFLVNTFNKLYVVGAVLKYRTASPKCTYRTPLYEGEFGIAGLVEANVHSTGERIESESEAGCEATASVSAKAKLVDQHHEANQVFWAERKSEKE
jgi:hypothetical protein